MGVSDLVPPVPQRTRIIIAGGHHRHMPSVFHWVKVKTICYATEDEDLLCRMTAGIAGTDELDVDVSEGLHGNPITVIDATLKKNPQYAALFKGLGEDVIRELLGQLEERIDEDCILYVRFDKQKAVEGVLEISHGGDVVSLTVREAGIVPALAVYDGYTERREMTGFAVLVGRLGLEETVVANPAGTITRELDDAVRNALENGPALIRVEGEEDLALMPVIRHAPDGAMIVYGWPGKGMMAVIDDEAVRSRIETLWKEMEEIE